MPSASAARARASFLDNPVMILTLGARRDISLRSAAGMEPAK